MSARRNTATVRALLLVLLVAAGAPRAQATSESAGTRAASFLSAGMAPATLSMGGASLALGNDLQGASANPAALGAMGLSQFTLAHASFADETAQDWLAAGGRLGHGLTRYGVSALLRDEGTIDARDAADQAIGAQRAQDLAFTFQLARPVGTHASLGGAVHVVNQHIGTVAATGYAFDAGAQVRLGLASFALAGQNFGGTMNWVGQRWRLPANFGAGMALEAPARGLRFALDVNAPADYFRSVRAGVEWRWRDRLALRGGWRAEQRAADGERLDGPSFGFGTGTGPWWLDYGYVIGGDGNTTHRFGLSLHRRPAAPANAPGPQRDETPVAPQVGPQR